jgi:hydrogenase expression/formation protein HypE
VPDAPAAHRPHRARPRRRRQAVGELIEHLFLPAFGAAAAGATPTDSAVLDLGNGTRLAFSTDTYVVRPLVFPGGDIGELAVNGTVNDLAMSGARPIALSTGFVLEEGLEMEVLGRIAMSMGRAASAAGVQLVTGDTKVVEQGHGDGLYVNTAGIGLVPDGVDIRPGRAVPGDVVIVSGDDGRARHRRDERARGARVRHRDPLGHRRAERSGRGDARGAPDPLDLHVLRDPTRGGLAASLCEIAEVAGVGVEFDERSVPVPHAVRAACGFLGLDPFHVANEGKLVAIVAAAVADAVLAAMRATHVGADAAVIGRVTDQHPGVVVVRTGLGAGRVVDRPLGEQLPRIC